MFIIISTLGWRAAERMAIGGTWNEEGQWLWKNGEMDTLELDSGNWIDGEPNLSGDCLLLWRSGYDDSSCQHIVKFVCEQTPQDY